MLQAADVRRTWTISLLGRLPIGITGLAILLLVQSATDSFAHGGVASGSYLGGLALLAPALGRAIDRYGPRLVLSACALAFPSALASLTLVVSLKAPIPLVYLSGALAGASFPPITVCLRTYLRRVFADDAALATAYSLESVLIELIFILGPALVALFVAFASPAAAVLFAAACGAGGTVLFLASPAVRAWRVAPHKSERLVGPWGERGFASLIAIILCYSCAFGLMEIGVTAYAAERGAPALAGVLLALMSVGSAIGGLAYGSRNWHLNLARQFCIALALMGGGLFVLVADWQPIGFGACCVMAGLVMAPALIIQSMLVAKSARPEHLTEAFTWSTSALLVGVGVGLCAGGALVSAIHWRAPIASAAAMAVAAALLGRVLLDDPAPNVKT